MLHDDNHGGVVYYTSVVYTNVLNCVRRTRRSCAAGTRSTAGTTNEAARQKNEGQPHPASFGRRACPLCSRRPAENSGRPDRMVDCSSRMECIVPNRGRHEKTNIVSHPVGNNAFHSGISLHFRVSPVSIREYVFSCLTRLGTMHSIREYRLRRILVQTIHSCQILRTSISTPRMKCRETSATHDNELRDFAPARA